MLQGRSSRSAICEVKAPWLALSTECTGVFGTPTDELCKLDGTLPYRAVAIKLVWRLASCDINDGTSLATAPTAIRGWLPGITTAVLAPCDTPAGTAASYMFPAMDTWEGLNSAAWGAATLEYWLQTLKELRCWPMTGATTREGCRVCTAPAATSYTAVDAVQVLHPIWYKNQSFQWGSS